MASAAQRLQEAAGYKQCGRFDEAIALLRGVLAEEPDQAQVHHELGLVYGFTMRLEESLEELERAVFLQPSSPTFRRDLGLTYGMVGEYEKAMEYLGPDDGPAGFSPRAGTPAPLLPVPPLRVPGNARHLPPKDETGAG